MSIVSDIVAFFYLTGSSSGCSRKSSSSGPANTSSASSATSEPEIPQAAPVPITLRNECLPVRITSTAQLTQLGCLTGGAASVNAGIEEVRNNYLGLFGHQLGNGTLIVRRPDDFAVSEGIGFGGLIFSASSTAESQAAYWQLYNARNNYFLQPSGVMAWSLNLDGSVRSSDSASDGDQDWIASELIMLDRVQCGQVNLPDSLSLTAFRDQVQRDLNAFWDNHIRERGNRLIFLPTNGTWAQRGDGRDVYYTNYADPSLLRLFAAFDPAHDWNRLANDVQALNQEVLQAHSSLGAAGQNPVPAKVFIQVNSQNFTVENYYEISRREGVTGDALVDNEADAIRFFLRQARAAVLDNDHTAQENLRQIVQIARITDPASAHLYAGAEGAPSPFGWSNTLARASYGLAVLGSGDTSSAEAFFCSVMNDRHDAYFGEWAGARDYYYDQSMILQIMDLAF
ncbi:MAG: hypothetical protein JW782_04050 [Candidatus Saganbacteria bacterium]|nr:hypothetical protein [Candidatus Saganbacteria bacterium]